MYEKAWFIEQINNNELMEQLSKIALVVTDVDGCLTNNTLHVPTEGDILAKTFNFSDGQPVQWAQDAGIHVTFLSGSRSTGGATHKQAQRVNLSEGNCFTVPPADKQHIIRELQERYAVGTQQTLLFGDDVQELMITELGKLFACPNTALFYVQDQADLVIPRAGGEGSFRLLMDLLLIAQDKHPYAEYIMQSCGM